MIIKTVLFLTVISIIGKYEGVHCSSYVNSYLKYTVKDFESFNVNCHLALYRVLHTDTHKEDNDLFGKMEMKERKKNMHQYLFRLLRIDFSINDSEKSYLMVIHRQIWAFYKIFEDAINPSNKTIMGNVESYARKLIVEGVNNNMWNEEGESFKEDYTNCDNKLKLISEPTEKDIKEHLSKIFYNQGAQYIQEIEKNKINENQSWKLPLLIKYGNILLLLKADEITEFMNLNSSNQKLIFIVDLMIEALRNIYFIIRTELKKCIRNIKAFRLETDEDKSIRVNFKILQSISTNLVDTTEAVYKIQEDRKNYSRLNRQDNTFAGTTDTDFIIEYTYSMDLARILFTEVRPFEVTDQDLRNEINKFIEIKNSVPGRLNNGNSIRVPIFKRMIPPETEKEEYMEKLLNSDNKSIQLLLEAYGWLIIIKEHAVLMIQDIQQKKTKDTTDMFNNDKEFLHRLFAP